jgi:hypothetical protein
MLQASPPDALTLRYDVAGPCPARAAFLHELAARSVRPPRGQLAIRVRSRPNGIVGTLEWRDVGEGATQRSVVGRTCAEVTRALALVAALAMDAPVRDAAQLGEPAQAADPEAPGTIELARSAPPAAAPGRTWSISGGTGISILGGVMPDAALTVPIFVEGSSRVLGLEPSLRLALQLAPSQAVSDRIGVAAFSFTAMRLDLCPVRWRTAGFSIGACARTDIGVIEAAGQRVPGARGESRPFFALGTLARARKQLPGAFFVELDGALLFPLIRDRFLFEPNTTVFAVPTIGAAAGINFGVHFL